MWAKFGGTQMGEIYDGNSKNYEEIIISYIQFWRMCEQNYNKFEIKTWATVIMVECTYGGKIYKNHSKHS